MRANILILVLLLIHFYVNPSKYARTLITLSVLLLKKKFSWERENCFHQNINYVTYCNFFSSSIKLLQTPFSLLLLISELSNKHLWLCMPNSNVNWAQFYHLMLCNMFQNFNPFLWNLFLMLFNIQLILQYHKWMRFVC